MTSTNENTRRILLVEDEKTAVISKTTAGAFDCGSYSYPFFADCTNACGGLFLRGNLSFPKDSVLYTYTGPLDIFLSAAKIFFHRIFSVCQNAGWIRECASSFRLDSVLFSLTRRVGFYGVFPCLFLFCFRIGYPRLFFRFLR